MPYIPTSSLGSLAGPASLVGAGVKGLTAVGTAAVNAVANKKSKDRLKALERGARQGPSQGGRQKALSESLAVTQSGLTNQLPASAGTGWSGYAAGERLKEVESAQQGALDTSAEVFSKQRTDQMKETEAFRKDEQADIKRRNAQTQAALLKTLPAMGGELARVAASEDTTNWLKLLSQGKGKGDYGNRVSSDLSGLKLESGERLSAHPEFVEGDPKANLALAMSLKQSGLLTGRAGRQTGRAQRNAGARDSLHLPKPTDQELAAASSTPPYTVKANQGLSHIAKETGFSMEELIEVNPGLRGRKGALIVDEEIILPRR